MSSVLARKFLAVQCWAIPSLLGVVSSFGLFAALSVDGATERLALAANAAPLIVVAIVLRNGFGGSVRLDPVRFKRFE